MIAPKWILLKQQHKSDSSEVSATGGLSLLANTVDFMANNSYVKTTSDVKSYCL